MLRPVGGGLYHLKQVNKKHQSIVEFTLLADSMLRIDTKVVPEMSRFFAGQLEGYGKLTVPYTAMVRGGIAQDTEMMKERAEDLLVKLIGSSDSLPQLSRH